jgi:hypothetical protein
LDGQRGAWTRPLNDGFVRTAPIPLVGFEATF